MRKILSILVLMVAMLAGGAGIAQASGTSLPPCEFEDSANCYWDASERGNGKGDSFVDIDGVAYYVGVHTECLRASYNCTIAEDGSMVGAQFYSDFPAPVEVAAPVEFAPAPAPAVVYSMVTGDSAAAWALFDAVGAADLLPYDGAAVAYVGGWDGSALSADELAVWDLSGNGYLFVVR